MPFCLNVHDRIGTLAEIAVDGSLVPRPCIFELLGVMLLHMDSRGGELAFLNVFFLFFFLPL